MKTLITALLLALPFLSQAPAAGSEEAPRAVIERAVKALGGEEQLKHRVGLRMKLSTLLCASLASIHSNPAESKSCS